MELHCFRPRQVAAELQPFDRSVVQILRDARGFFRSSGIDAGLIANRLHVRSAALVRRALVRLRDAGVAREVAPGLWRIA